MILDIGNSALSIQRETETLAQVSASGTRKTTPLAATFARLSRRRHRMPHLQHVPGQ